MKKDACKACREKFKRKAGQIPCQKCKLGLNGIALMPGNREALSFWRHVQTQWRVGGMGPIGLDYPAVRIEAKELGITISYGLMRKLQALEYFEIKKLIAKNDNRKSKITGSKET